ncbi:MAG: hypothetical protein HZA14_10800 [Nitrospirae bacterium]|nr:hypothetical protein [Nitrospirota bacterium]
MTVTTPALALFVEKGEVITAYMNWLHYLYESADKSKGGYWLISDEKKKMVQAFEITKALLDRISTQVYAGEKWKWLKVESEE